MANNCESCGTPLSPKDKFCSNCGQPRDAAPTITQEVSKLPKTATPAPLTPSSRLGAAFWLGFIGGIIGIFIGVVILGLLFAFGKQSLEGCLGTIGLIVFSIIGIVSPLRIVNKRDTINAALMILAGVGVLVSAEIFGIFSALFFFIGGALLYLKKG